MATKGRTYGRPNTPWGSKIYFKPSMGRVIARKPGVLRKSDDVLAINKVLEDLKGSSDHPATKCKGKPGGWKEFVSCLRDEMKKALKEAGKAKS